MITGKENLVAFMNTNSAPYWRLFHHGSNTNKFGEVDHSKDNLSMLESLNLLEEVFKTLGYSGRYSFQCKQTKDGTKTGVFNTEFQFSLEDQRGAFNDSQPAQIAGGSSFNHNNNITSESVQKQIDSALKIQALEYEKKDLERRLKEEKEDKTPSYMPLIEEIAGIFGPIIKDRFKQSKVAIGEVATSEEIDIKKTAMSNQTKEDAIASFNLTKEDQLQIKDSLEEMLFACYKMGIEPVNFLTLIGDELRKNPKQARTIKKFLD